MAKTGKPFENLLTDLQLKEGTFKYYDVSNLEPEKYDKLPFSIRILLESAIRNCDNFEVKETDVKKILEWETHQASSTAVEVPFKPARVILQDFTGVPAVVDFAAMRDAVKSLGGDPAKINPICPADLVIDHSVQVDFSRSRLAVMAERTSRNQRPCHLQYHRPRSRPMSPLYTRPQSPFFSPVLLPQEEVMVDPFVPMCPPQFMHYAPRGAYYAGAPYVMLPQWQDSQIPDRSRGKQSAKNDFKISEPTAPSLKVPVSSLPSPQDVPGIPLQDTICPFHQLSSTWSEALHKNQELEFDRNKERFVFLKWGSQALKNMLIVPPGSGIVHQVNLEYLARVVFAQDGLLYPDSLVGTDSHTTMINGLGIVGWGVGGIEAEAVMLGQSISMVLPKVLGYKIRGNLSPLATSTDVVLTITKHLRQIGVVGKFVEFFGEGVTQLSLADRATISNMCPEYGATIGFFPVDHTALAYLKQTNRDEDTIKRIETYLKAVKMFRRFGDENQDPIFSEIVELDLGEVVPSVSGPKRPHDRVAVSDMKDDFAQCLSNKVSFKGFGIASDQQLKTASFQYQGEEYELRHGSVVIAAITSCTNTSNPSVMLGAGLLAKKAVEAGLSVLPYIKTSLSPGSGVVTHYLQHSGVTPYLSKLGFDIVGYGCMTCIGNSGPLPENISEAIEKNDLVCAGVLSGNRNFEGRIHPNTRANYLASPLLVIAYAIAGRIDIDFENEPLGRTDDGTQIYLSDVWPSRHEIQEVEKNSVLPAMFADVYKSLSTGNPRWNALIAPQGILYPWDESSTYIKKAPFFDGMTKDLPAFKPIKDAYVLLNLGDSVTTDHISPAGSIARNSAAARYLAAHGLTTREFNSYGSRRGNDAVMARGTFANIRLVNKFIGKAAPKTIHFPSTEQLDVFDAAERYKQDGHSVIILAGKEYGSGSSRDWAAKGPFLLGVRAVIAESYERIHRSNLVGMGIMPMQFLPGQNAESLGLTGKERFTIDLPEQLVPEMPITITTDNGKSFDAILRFDTEVELAYFRHGGILNYMIRKMV